MESDIRDKLKNGHAYEVMYNWGNNFGIIKLSFIHYGKANFNQFYGTCIHDYDSGKYKIMTNESIKLHYSNIVKIIREIKEKEYIFEMI